MEQPEQGFRVGDCAHERQDLGGHLPDPVLHHPSALLDHLGLGQQVPPEPGGGEEAGEEGAGRPQAEHVRDVFQHEEDLLQKFRRKIQELGHTARLISLKVDRILRQRIVQHLVIS